MALPLFHVIKGVIDLYSVEALRIEAKHFLGRDLFRIEFSFPFPVSIPDCTDIDFHISWFFTTAPLRELISFSLCPFLFLLVLPEWTGLIPEELI
jgi:hypothetical protein